jgi:hypothetical protein
MEKGVIRRARMRFYLSVKEVFDAKMIEKLFEEFQQSELPLTT